MHVTINQITERLKTAPQEVLDRLMGYLDGITIHENTSDIPQWHKEILDVRLAEINNPEKLEPIEELFKSLDTDI